MRRAMFALAVGAGLPSIATACGGNVSIGSLPDPVVFTSDSGSDFVVTATVDASVDEPATCLEPVGTRIDGATPPADVVGKLAGSWIPCASDDPVLSSQALDFIGNRIFFYARVADASYAFDEVTETFTVNEATTGAAFYELTLAGSDGSTATYALYLFENPTRIRLLDLTSGQVSDFVPSGLDFTLADAGVDADN